MGDPILAIARQDFGSAAARIGVDLYLPLVGVKGFVDVRRVQRVDGG